MNRNQSRNAGSNRKGKSQSSAGGRNNGRARGGAQAAAVVDAPVQKNDEVVVDIIGLTHDGEGVGRADGFTLFIQGALPGERVRAKVMKVKKTFGYARLQELLDASADRIVPVCGIYDKCGGCQLQHMNYDAQLSWKRQHVIDALERIGKLTIGGDDKEGVVVHPTVGMTEPWRYRNKAQVPIGAGVSASGSQELIAGFYAKGSHRIIDTDECHIQHDRNDEVVRIVKTIGRELGVSVYDEESGQGLLRHVMTRTGFVSGEIMIVLVTNGRKLPQAEQWVERIRTALPEVKSIVQNVNTRDTNVIFGDETKVLWGSEVIYDELDGIRFAISARSFYQVNPAQTVELYRKAVDYAQLTGTESVIDAYCGIGTISLFLARKAGRVYGVEIVPEAIEDAKRNAKLNDITNASFEAGPAEVVIPRWREEGIIPDVIVVDPPRKGCDPALLDTILAMQPERVVYVSCNPSTLARDLQTLEEGGYKTVEVTPVDMFPWTSHVESVVWMEKRK
ncbi:23S rRNA (uracil(1939)-C(5))-methyltransferase RlmD [Paenibacillus lupini]|uniref:23S rRNA (uracil(1939)-C(5))-methyltransferase RlmD n=1 Tax=Paenibacillus lupini TaxID=1450204 RepID=UPI001ABA4553|nr:23S rRNA (uracil(1939)-C(5))-methyltransferase RlmD [Paenibacillus lupini]NIK23484.1 23S rRNA (uracil1939-C5)-methyltransferase [Paenibacillus lupini]